MSKQCNESKIGSFKGSVRRPTKMERLLTVLFSLSGSGPEPTGENSLRLFEFSLLG